MKKISPVLALMIAAAFTSACLVSIPSGPGGRDNPRGMGTVIVEGRTIGDITAV